MDYLRKMKVYDKVPIQKCRGATGKFPTRVRWVDTNMQDELDPKYRGRLVAKDFKRWVDPDLYTAMLPIDSLRCLVRFAVMGWSRAGRCGAGVLQSAKSSANVRRDMRGGLGARRSGDVRGAQSVDVWHEDPRTELEEVLHRVARRPRLHREKEREREMLSYMMTMLCRRRIREIFNGSGMWSSVSSKSRRRLLGATRRTHSAPRCSVA